MKHPPLTQMTVTQLVEHFLKVTLNQDDANLEGDTGKYNRLFREMCAITEQLKARPGDQRRALLRLLEHPNAQTRLQSAIATLALAPDAARRALQIISDRQEYPQAADARGMMRALDEGTYTPN
jgi:Domain of unknown function (DUF2019)